MPRETGRILLDAIEAKFDVVAFFRCITGPENEIPDAERITEVDIASIMDLDRVVPNVQLRVVEEVLETVADSRGHSPVRVRGVAQGDSLSIRGTDAATTIEKLAEAIKPPDSPNRAEMTVDNTSN